MLSLTMHLVQGFESWSVRVTLVRDNGVSFTPEISSAVDELPITNLEYDSDDLSACLSAIARWSGMTSDCNRVHEDD